MKHTIEVGMPVFFDYTNPKINLRIWGEGTVVKLVGTDIDVSDGSVVYRLPSTAVNYRPEIA